MKQLFAQIESELAVHKDGWCSIEKAYALASAIIALRPGVVVEIGIWAGRSLIPMALALKKVGAGKIIGIDPWRAEESAKEIRKRVEDLGRHLGSYEQFMTSLGSSLSTTVNNYNKAHKELGKIDKDVIKITGESAGINPLSIEKPERDED